MQPGARRARAAAGTGSIERTVGPVLRPQYFGSKCRTGYLPARRWGRVAHRLAFCMDVGVGRVRAASPGGPCLPDTSLADIGLYRRDRTPRSVRQQPSIGRSPSLRNTDRSLFVVKSLSGFSSEAPDGLVSVRSGAVGWCRAREWLGRRAGARSVSRPRWRQSRSPVALPGPWRWPLRRPGARRPGGRRPGGGRRWRR